MSRGPSKWTVLAVLFLLLVVLDQGTKFLAVDRLTTAFQTHGQVGLADKLGGFYSHRHLEDLTTRGYTVWAPAWRMVYVENPGAAFSFLSGAPEGLRQGFFPLITVLAVVVVLVYYRRLRDDQRYSQLALAMLLAGAVGNFLDRLARGYVIDFIDWYVGHHHWPTFNLADSLIVVGVAMLLLNPGQKKAASSSGAQPEREPARKQGT